MRVHPVTQHRRKIIVTELGFFSATSPILKDVRLAIARPGESVRAIPVKDVIESRPSRIPVDSDHGMLSAGRDCEATVG
jgi:hypothetical protein